MGWYELQVPKVEAVQFTKKFTDNKWPCGWWCVAVNGIEYTMPDACFRFLFKPTKEETK